MSSESPSPQDNKRREWASLLLGVTLSSAGAVFVASHMAAFENFVARIGVLGPLISITLLTAFGASPIPTEALNMVNGAMFGPIKGALYSWIGYMLASVIEYYIGKRMGHASDFDGRQTKLPFGLGRFPADSPWFLILARIVPGYGPKVVGIVGGMYRVPLWRFIWTAAIATAVGALAFAYGGHSLKSLLLGAGVGHL